MVDVFPDIKNVLDVIPVRDFCQSPIQQLPFNSGYAKQAAEQLLSCYNNSIWLSEVSGVCLDICRDIVDDLTTIPLWNLRSTDDLVICYGILRKAIVMLIMLAKVFSSEDATEYKTCLSYIEEGKVTLGIDLGEAAIAHSY